jgi:hypothetical protein
VRAVCALAVLLIACLPAQAQTASPRNTDEIEARAAGALAVLGLAAVPTETASTLSFIGRDDGEFRSAQFGGGSTVQGGPLYLEGYLGWNAYDPVFVFSGGSETTTLEAQWKSVAFTGGVGWDFPLQGGVIFRPILIGTLGNITSDISDADEGLAEEITSFLNGGMTVGGIGGSLMLDYTRRYANGWRLDGTLRHSRLYLEPIAGDREVVGHATAVTTALWTRLTLPTRLQAMGRPVRAVSEVSVGYFGGDQGEVLDTAWLAQVGAGAEVDLADTDLPWVKTGRVMLRYARGSRLEGVSLGVSASF